MAPLCLHLAVNFGHIFQCEIDILASEFIIQTGLKTSICGYKLYLATEKSFQ